MTNKHLAIDGGTPVRPTAMTVRAQVGQREYELIKAVLDSGKLSEFRAGPKTREFENLFAAAHDCRRGVAVPSGTAALHLSVTALNIGPGDEVIVPPFTFVATATAVLQQRATPVFADIDPVTYCIAPRRVEEMITPRTKAVIAVHLFGHPAELESLRRITERRGLALIEDAAQAHGAKYNGRRVGSFGEFGCFSFYQSKNMTCGEGGMTITNDENLYVRARLLKEHGNSRDAECWYQHEALGYNYQMSELQAAVGLAQLERLDEMNGTRRRYAAIYRRQLGELGLILPEEVGNIEHVYHLFPVLLPSQYAARRDWFVEALEAENILVGINYPNSLHQDTLFASLSERVPHLNPTVTYSDEQVLVTLDVASRIFTLHTDPCLTEQDILDACRAVEKVWTHLVALTGG